MVGLVDEIIGHISVRVREDRMLIRCRAPEEDGVLFTQPSAIREFDLEGEPAEDLEGHQIPLEHHLHGEIYRQRPEISCVVHAHPPWTLLCGIAGVELRAIRTYDYMPAQLVHSGIPVYPSASLINSVARAKKLCASLAEHSVCLMRGHGIVTVADELSTAVLRAIKMEKMAKANWRVASSGRELIEMDNEEWDDAIGNPRSSLARGSEWTWRFYERLLNEAEHGRRWTIL